MPAAGDRAPEVALPDENGTIHRLADQRGRWTLVYFYPEDDTPGCTTEACQFRDLHDDIRDEGAEVWGISPDGAASHRRFRDKFALPFTLLSDEDHAVAEAYGAWALKKNYGREYMGIVRSSFLVDPDGTDRPGLAAGQGRRPRRRGPRRARRGEGRCGPLSAAGARWQAVAPGMKGGLARGGRRAKPRARLYGSASVVQPESARAGRGRRDGHAGR